MTVTVFGHWDDGSDVLEAHLEGDGLRVSVIGYGASIRTLDVERRGGYQPTVLALPSLPDYRQYASHMGAIAGRFGNRIAGGGYTVMGKRVTLPPTEFGVNHLHGGPVGFGKRKWAIADHGPRHAILVLESADGDQGHPGKMEVSATYRITGPGVLSIEIEATTDAPTVCNLVTHSYFNLDSSPDILDHHLRIAADAFLPLDDKLIPTGEVRAVAGTAHDFRAMRPIRLVGADGERVRYDNAFVLAPANGRPRFAGRLESHRNGLALEVHSTEPLLQLYDGAKMSIPVEGMHGWRYGNAAGVCLEPERFPNAPNTPGFPSAFLMPGETYRQVTEYRFADV